LKKSRENATTNLIEKAPTLKKKLKLKKHYYTEEKKEQHKKLSLF